jgi:hypothetical protein
VVILEEAKKRGYTLYNNTMKGLSFACFRLMILLLHLVVVAVAATTHFEVLPDDSIINTRSLGVAERGLLPATRPHHRQLGKSKSKFKTLSTKNKFKEKSKTVHEKGVSKSSSKSKSKSKSKDPKGSKGAKGDGRSKSPKSRKRHGSKSKKSSKDPNKNGPHSKSKSKRSPKDGSHSKSSKKSKHAKSDLTSTSLSKKSSHNSDGVQVLKEAEITASSQTSANSQEKGEEDDTSALWNWIVKETTMIRHFIGLS